MNALLVDQFVASHAVPPKEIILDFDATDDAVHGNQEGCFFHGYYDHYCSLYVFCGSQLLCAYLHLSKIDGAKHAWAILALLSKRLRQTWPDVNIIFRGDSGFYRWKIEGARQQLYDYVYCARGDMENRIKEQQLDLYADRTSFHN